jgi:hypothetical protein
LNVTAALLQIAQSIDLLICSPTEFGINQYPPLKSYEPRRGQMARLLG